MKFFFTKTETLPDNFLIALRSDITVTHIHDRVVLFSKERGDHFGLNSTAFELLDALKKNSAKYVANDIATKYETSSTEVRADLIKLVMDLQKNKIITIIPIKDRPLDH